MLIENDLWHLLLTLFCFFCLPGLDEGDQDSNDPASLQGAYLSFLQLRHLRIRDLHRTVSHSGMWWSRRWCKSWSLAVIFLVHNVQEHGQNVCHIKNYCWYFIKSFKFSPKFHLHIFMVLLMKYLCIIISQGNGLAPIRHQAIPQTGNEQDI